MFGNGVFFFVLWTKALRLKMSRLWFTKLLDIGDREKTFFFFSFLSFVFRRNLDETPISSAGRLCNSFCKGIKILGWQSVSTFESPSAIFT